MKAVVEAIAEEMRRVEKTFMLGVYFRWYALFVVDVELCVFSKEEVVVLSQRWLVSQKCVIRQNTSYVSQQCQKLETVSQYSRSD